MGPPDQGGLEVWALLKAKETGVAIYRLSGADGFLSAKDFCFGTKMRSCRG